MYNYGALGAVFTGRRFQLAADVNIKATKHLMHRQDKQTSSVDCPKEARMTRKEKTTWL
jgi:hypothetical protein